MFSFENVRAMTKRALDEKQEKNNILNDKILRNAEITIEYVASKGCSSVEFYKNELMISDDENEVYEIPVDIFMDYFHKLGFNTYLNSYNVCVSWDVDENDGF